MCHYLVDSSDVKTQHSVAVLSMVCPSQPNCMPYCEEDRCRYLCHHMI